MIFRRGPRRVCEEGRAAGTPHLWLAAEPCSSQRHALHSLHGSSHEMNGTGELPCPFQGSCTGSWQLAPSANTPAACSLASCRA
jgi:hypothetical protein